MSFLLTLLCVVGIAIGQILFKQAARASGIDASPAGMFNNWMFAALALYGLATLLWIYVLRVVPLAVAYPLFALAFIIVPVLAHFWLGEPLRWSSFIGGALIVSGVIVSTRGGA
jgi:drug/metabolite transporter (DMT)-like permease